MSRKLEGGLYKGLCFFCLEAIAAWREKGWDYVYQSPVCGPCLSRIRFLQEHIYDSNGENLYDEVKLGEWATDKARAWWGDQILADKEKDNVTNG